MVDHALKRLGLLGQVRDHLALQAFARCSGADLLGRVRAERCVRGTLYLRVESSAWASQISFVKKDLLAKLQATPGGEGIQDLRFSVGPLGDLPTWIDPPAKKPPPPDPVPIDHRVAAALTQVRDDDLRDALGALYVTSCRGGKQR